MAKPKAPHDMKGAKLKPYDSVMIPASIHEVRPGGQLDIVVGFHVPGPDGGPVIIEMAGNQVKKTTAKGPGVKAAG